MDITEYLNSRKLPMKDTIVEEKGLESKIKSFSGDLIDQVLVAAVDSNRPLSGSQLEAIQLLMPLIHKTLDLESIAPDIDLSGKETSEKVDMVLSELSKGHISFKSAESYIEIIGKGHEIVEMNELNEKLQQLSEVG